jgi:hypothetical protein
MTMRGRKNSKQYMDYNFFDLILTGCFMQVKSKFLFGVSNKIGALLNSKINMELSWASTIYLQCHKTVSECINYTIRYYFGYVNYFVVVQ